MTNKENNSRIAKNTGMLYVRMLLTMVVSLYTSRIVLSTLGVEDFGIYNVVGGFVTMFSFLNSAMASATQRFLSFEIGRKNFQELANVFSMSINIHFVIAFIILLFAETLGLWFVNNKLTIPPERMLAVNWVYQFSILALLVSVVSVPYNAAIIAHEKMGIFAWVSILEVTLKLLIVFMLQLFGFDKLKLYAILLFVVALIIRLVYGIYCRRNFKESKFRFFWDKKLFKTLMSFASWNLWGSASVVFYSQGLNILLNVFFGPLANAAYGIAFRLQSTLNSFVLNFQMAMNPQIIKSYAKKDIGYMHELIYKGAKYSFFLLFILALPILLETEMILRLWLKTVPEYSVIFTQLIIINILIGNLSGSLGVAAQATGKIKLYQGVIGGLLLLILPISYVFLKLGFPPRTVFYVNIVISAVSLFIRLVILKKLIQIKISDYLLEVVVKAINVGLIALVFPLAICVMFEDSLYRLFMVIIMAMFSTICTIYFIGLNKIEKDYVLNIFLKYFRKIFQKNINEQNKCNE